MKIEDYNILKKYEQNFNTAIYHNYTRNIPIKELDILLGVYERNTNRKYNLCKHCTSSILAFIKVIGNMYFNEVNKMEIKEEKQDTNGKASKNVGRRKNK